MLHPFVENIAIKALSGNVSVNNLVSFYLPKIVEKDLLNSTIRLDAKV